MFWTFSTRVPGIERFKGCFIAAMFWKSSMVSKQNQQPMFCLLLCASAPRVLRLPQQQQVLGSNCCYSWFLPNWCHHHLEVHRYYLVLYFTISLAADRRHFKKTSLEDDSKHLSVESCFQVPCKLQIMLSHLLLLTPTSVESFFNTG